MTEPSVQRPHRVVVVGGGFGGLSAVRALRRAPVEVTLVDRRNFHLFQPLLYQVATGSLSPGEIASPLRGILKRQRNASVLLAEVAGFDLEARRVHLGHQANGAESGELPYDSLIVAGGASHSYFGNDDWEQHAPGLKVVEDALQIRRRMLSAFEAAELEPDPERRKAWLTFVVVGAGPTGVELAGQIAEIARHTLKRDFRSIDPSQTVVLLVEAADRVLTAYTPKLSAKAERALERLGVTPLLDTKVVDIDPGTVTMARGDAPSETVPARTVIWAAGVAASPLARALAEASGAETDRAGRVTVNGDLTLPGHPEVYAIGDMVRVADGASGVLPLPGVAQPAIQEGRYAARAIRARLAGREPRGPFAYRDKGNLATIGRNAAVADVKGLRFAGFAAWLTWLFVHLLFLVGLQNRLVVFVRWTLSFMTRGRAQRLITGEESAGRGSESPPAGILPAGPKSRPSPPVGY
jgi:NADH dehydrogenase